MKSNLPKYVSSLTNQQPEYSSEYQNTVAWASYQI